MTTTLVTGAAGFIGFHLTRALLARGESVVGVDALTPYYDVDLKEARLKRLIEEPAFRFEKLDLSDRSANEAFFVREKIARVVHLAAQPGVRDGGKPPYDYVDNNLVATAQLLEGCRRVEVGHLLFASSSSVYGASEESLFSVEQAADRPISFYAATKRAGELMAHSYSHLYRLPTTVARLFTVYGPWGRPDMAPMKFSRAILEGRPIEVYDAGELRRDFTYIDDVVECLVRLLDRPPTARIEEGATMPKGNDIEGQVPYRIFNVGTGRPVTLNRLIEQLELAWGKTAQKRFLSRQPGEVTSTCAEIESLYRAIGFRPEISLEEGIARLVDWYQNEEWSGKKPD